MYILNSTWGMGGIGKMTEDDKGGGGGGILSQILADFICEWSLTGTLTNGEKAKRESKKKIKLKNKSYF